MLKSCRKLFWQGLYSFTDRTIAQVGKNHGNSGTLLQVFENSGTIDPSGTTVRNPGVSRTFRDGWQLCEVTEIRCRQRRYKVGII